MTRPTVILGAGGHAGVLAECLLAMNRPIRGYVAPADQGDLLAGISWLGDDTWLERQPPMDHDLANGLGSTADNSLRRALFTTYRNAGFRFPPLFHPAAVISPSVELGQAVQVLAGAIINRGTRIGDNVIVNTRALVEHDCVIGEHSHIAPGAIVCGGCRIGENVHVGAGATIIQGITIGNGAIIAAGSTVTKQVKSLTLVAGTPAREKCSLTD